MGKLENFQADWVTDNRGKRWLPLLATFCFVLFSSVQARDAMTLPVAGAQVSDEVVRLLAATDAARILILLDDTAGTAAATAVAQRQASVLNSLTPTEFQLYRQYQSVPGLAGTITAAGLAKLRVNPLVRTIQLDHPGGVHLQESLPALGGHIVHNTYGLTGQGVTVAVLDSGIDTDHPDLADDLVAQHCFTQRTCPLNGDSESANAEDENGHGSHVAGIITAKGTVSGKGFAPDAKIVAVRVLDGNGSGFVSDWVAGLDWVRANLATTPVRIVNLSLGTFALYTGACDGQESLLAAAVNQLRTQGVTIFASSGNQGSASRIAAPACNSGVIAVGATYDSNVGRQPASGTYQSHFGSSWPACADDTTNVQQITCFTNSNSQLDLLAPGAPIASSYFGGGTATYWGTSQASPTAAGIAALLLGKRPALTPATVESILKASGPLLTDTRNGLTFTSINALNAINAITPITPTALALTGPITGVTGVAYPFTATVTPITVTLPITYQWQLSDLPTVTQSGNQQQTRAWTWTTPGRKAVTVTAFNVGGVASATQFITVAAVAPTAVTLTGPLSLATGITDTFRATVAPLTTTTPITYVWRLAGRPPVTQTNGITDLLALAWEGTGVQAISVTAQNEAGFVSAALLVSVQEVAPVTVTLDAPLTTLTGVSTTITAHVLPITVSLPMTYTWQATDQLSITHRGAVSDTLVYRWLTSNPVTVTVQAQNRAGAIFAQRVILITNERRLYLPLVRRP